MLASASLGEEGLEGVIPEGLIGGHVTIGLDAMLKAVELPTGVSNLATGLADVDGDALTLRKARLETMIRDGFSGNLVSFDVRSQRQ